jgi:hypothetical protein
MSYKSICLSVLTLAISSAAYADLKVYDVEPEYRDEVFGALDRVFEIGNSGNRSPRWAVERLPTGQLLVDAPPEGHEQVARVLEAIRASDVRPAERVTLRYWVIYGEVNGGTEDVPPDLRGVIAELERVHGDLGFRVLGSASLATESGSEGRINAPGGLSVEQIAFVQGEAISAEVRLEFRYGYSDQAEGSGQPIAQDLEVETTLGRSDYVVLGESALNGAEASGLLFYVVHWPGE